MTKIICDICGKEMEKSILLKSVEEFNFSIILHGNTLDVCNECKEAFKRWRDSRKNRTEKETE